MLWITHVETRHIIFVCAVVVPVFVMKALDVV